MAAMAEVVRPVNARDVVAPLLPSLPAAAVVSEPASHVLPLLSPILRQRVQFLSASSSEPWIRLLAYDPAKAAQLVEVARSSRLEPHPLSGEIEVDWDSCSGRNGTGNGNSNGSHSSASADVQIRYRRLDVETLQALVLLRDLDLVFRLVHCTSDHESTTAGSASSSGWRVDEVSIPDKPHAFASFGNCRTISEAEQAFAEGEQSRRDSMRHGASNGALNGNVVGKGNGKEDDGDDGDDDDDDDDDYWARYDATPARTPAVKRSPAPAAMTRTSAEPFNKDAEDAYFAQYSSVQPAMDSYDPDEAEAATLAAPVPAPPPVPAPSSSQSVVDDSFERGRLLDSNRNSSGHNSSSSNNDNDNNSKTNFTFIHHPRPASVSSQGSAGSGSAAVAAAALVAKLEESAGKKEQNEFGVKQHVSRTIKSLYMLARASGIDREDFDQLVKTELDLLSMMEETE